MKDLFTRPIRPDHINTRALEYRPNSSLSFPRRSKFPSFSSTFSALFCAPYTSLFSAPATQGLCLCLSLQSTPSPRQPHLPSDFIPDEAPCRPAPAQRPSAGRAGSPSPGISAAIFNVSLIPSPHMNQERRTGTCRLGSSEAQNLESSMFIRDRHLSKEVKHRGSGTGWREKSSTGVARLGPAGGRGVGGAGGGAAGGCSR